jgi:transglutaminase-like putative cysteine protease
VTTLGRPRDATRSLQHEAETVVKVVRHELSPAALAVLREILRFDLRTLRPVSSAGPVPTRTVTIPADHGQEFGRYLGETDSAVVVEHEGRTMAFDREFMTRMEDYRPWQAPLRYDDVVVDLANDPAAREFVERGVREVDPNAPVVEKLTRIIDYVRRALGYDGEYWQAKESQSTTVSESGAWPSSSDAAPFGNAVAKGSGICTHFAVAVKILCDAVDIPCRIEQGRIGRAILPEILRKELSAVKDPRIKATIQELLALAGSPANGGMHAWNQITVGADEISWALDATLNTLSPTVFAYGSGRLKPSFRDPWWSRCSWL